MQASRLRSSQNVNMELRQPLPRTTALAISFIAPILLIAIWCILTYGNLVSPDTLPTPTEVIRGTLQLFIQYDLANSVLVSSKRIGLAFILAAAVALPLGVLMGAFEPVNRFFEPIIAPLRYMPISAFIPLSDLVFRHLRIAKDRVFVSRRFCISFAGRRVCDSRRSRRTRADGSDAWRE